MVAYHATPTQVWLQPLSSLRKKSLQTAYSERFFFLLILSLTWWTRIIRVLIDLFCFELQLPCVVPFISPGNAGVVVCGIIVYAGRDRGWWLMVWRGLEDYDSRIPSGSSRINTSSWGLSIHTNIKNAHRFIYTKWKRTRNRILSYRHKNSKLNFLRAQSRNDIIFCVYFGWVWMKLWLHRTISKVKAIAITVGNGCRIFLDKNIVFAWSETKMLNLILCKATSAFAFSRGNTTQSVINYSPNRGSK